MKNVIARCLYFPCWFYIIGIIFLCPVVAMGQKNSIVQVHADQNSGYGIAWGGPNLIVTALHIVAGKTKILVVYQGKPGVEATVEKIYKPSDLALLRLKTPLAIPQLTLYSGEPPYDTNINFWEIPSGTVQVTAKTTVLEEKTNLATISPRVANNPAGLSKSLCSDAGQYYPGMNTQVINFKEPNIRKAHSGSPLTSGDKVLGMIDGGAKLTDGKACVWAIPAADFNKLRDQGTPLAKPMQSCTGTGGANQYMYSGLRSDNPMLTPDEVKQAREMESALVQFTDDSGDSMLISNEFRLSFGELYETMTDPEQKDIADLFSEESKFDADKRLSLDDLLDEPIDLFLEEKTGVSVALPSGSTISLSRDAFGTLIKASSPKRTASISIYISANDTEREVDSVFNQFKAVLRSMCQQVDAQPEHIIDYRSDPTNPYYSEFFENVAMDKKGVQSEYFANMIINETNFMAVTVSASDWKTLWNTKEERSFFYLLEACALLADFPIY